MQPSNNSDCSYSTLAPLGHDLKEGYLEARLLIPKTLSKSLDS